jgi:hypothetical protein
MSPFEQAAIEALTDLEGSALWHNRHGRTSSSLSWALAIRVKLDALLKLVRQEPSRIAELESENARLRDLISNGPAASCTVHEGHDYDAQGVCVRGCGIPEDGFAHGLQRQVARLRAAVEQ